MIRKLGTGLLDLGTGNGDRVGLISDNRYEWILCDLAVLGRGAIDVPRGSDSTPKELEYILAHAEIETAFVENTTRLDKVYAIAENLPELKHLVLIEEHGELDAKRYRAIRVHTIRGLTERGEALLAEGDVSFPSASRAVRPDDLATIDLTSGTKGEPKGVMLTHRNVMHNAVLYKIGKESAARRALFHLFVWTGIRRRKSVLTLRNLMPRFGLTVLEGYRAHGDLAHRVGSDLRAARPLHGRTASTRGRGEYRRRKRNPAPPGQEGDHHDEGSPGHERVLPIERKLAKSPLVHQAVVVGQDRKKLGVLVVPNFENLKAFAEAENIPFASVRSLIENERVIDAHRHEIRSLISHRNGFKTNELPTSFRPLSKEFEIGKDLTHTLKTKRSLIAETFGVKIESMHL